MDEEAFPNAQFHFMQQIDYQHQVQAEAEAS
jgi:hypothetical protein